MRWASHPSAALFADGPQDARSAAIKPITRIMEDFFFIGVFPFFLSPPEERQARTPWGSPQ